MSFETNANDVSWILQRRFTCQFTLEKLAYFPKCSQNLTVNHSVMLGRETACFVIPGCRVGTKHADFPKVSVNKRFII